MVQIEGDDDDCLQCRKTTYIPVFDIKIWDATTHATVVTATAGTAR